VAYKQPYVGTAVTYDRKMFMPPATDLEMKPYNIFFLKPNPIEKFCSKLDRFTRIEQNVPIYEKVYHT